MARTVRTAQRMDPVETAKTQFPTGLHMQLTRVCSRSTRLTVSESHSLTHAKRRSNGPFRIDTAPFWNTFVSQLNRAQSDASSIRGR
jgi:hypothetical protein